MHYSRARSLKRDGRDHSTSMKIKINTDSNCYKCETKNGLILAIETLWFRNTETHVKSKTNLLCDNDWPTSSPNLARFSLRTPWEQAWT